VTAVYSKLNQHLVPYGLNGLMNSVMVFLDFDPCCTWSSLWSSAPSVWTYYLCSSPTATQKLLFPFSVWLSHTFLTLSHFC